MEEQHAIDRLGVAIADHVRDTKSRWSDEMHNAWNAAADEHRNMLIELRNIKTIAFHLGEDKLELQSRVTELETLVGANEHRWAAELNERVYRVAELEEGIRQHLAHHENGCTYLSHLVAPNDLADRREPRSGEASSPKGEVERRVGPHGQGETNA